MELRPIRPDELPAFARAAEGAFHEDLQEDDLALAAELFEPERSLAVLDGPTIVATTTAYGRELTVPGATIGAACVSEVGVLPTHRRRGLLTRLMRRQLEDLRDRREPLAILWASEAAIYGRFGYGLASRSAELSLRTAGARLHPAVSMPRGRTSLVEPGEALPLIAPLYDAVRRRRVGHLDRTGAWWSKRVHDPERRRDGASALRGAVHEGAGGEVDGYALYAVRPAMGPDGPDGEVVVREVVADGAAATAAVWGYLLGIDLTRRITWAIAPPDEPLAHLIEGPQHARMAVSQNLWVRLVDVGAALSARGYALPLDVVLEVDDPFCAWNTGRWRLESDGHATSSTRTDAPADLAVSAADLASAYLGGPTLVALAAAGRVRELHAGALEAASVAFRATREPWCPEIF